MSSIFFSCHGWFLVDLAAKYTTVNSYALLPESWLPEQDWSRIACPSGRNNSHYLTIFLFRRSWHFQQVFWANCAPSAPYTNRSVCLEKKQFSPYYFCWGFFLINTLQCKLVWRWMWHNLHCWGGTHKCDKNEPQKQAPCFHVSPKLDINMPV